ncbi:MAG TPA: hypothetical protein VIZ67_06235 [Acidimicrobiales bacterium]
MRTTRAGRFRAPSTPFLLRLGMALACLPVVAFAVAIHVGVERNDSTVRTVGREATRGISVAQTLKVELAELDGVVVRSLLGRAPLNTTGFPDDYNAKRAELHDRLVLAALVSSSASVYEQPLVNIDYVLSHYHALAKDAFAAARDGDIAGASETYGQAHQVMAETLLPEADFLDKANSYVLNDSYDRHTARSASTARLILVSWLAVLAFLVLAQVLVAKRFRRVLNLGLALATVVALVSGALTLNRLDASSDHLTSAREQDFDSVHVLARARATVESARQAQGQFLLGPPAAAEAQTDFDHHVSRLLRVQGSSPTDVTDVAEASTLPAGAGGYLARVASPGATNPEPESVRQVMVAFGAFLNEDAAMRDLVTSGGLGAATARYMDGRAYGDLNDAINAAQGIEQEAFDDAAGAAADAAAPLDDINLVSAPAILLLALLGLFQRLREYRA